MNGKHLFLLWLCCCLVQFSLAQDYQILIYPVDAPASHLPQSKSIKNAAEGISQVKKQIHQLQEEGYLTASVDSFLVSDSMLTVYMYKGGTYKWARLSFDRIPAMLFDAAGLNRSAWSEQVLHPGRLTRLQQKLLSWCENNGFPFARTYLDSITMEKEGIRAQLVLDRGPSVKIDQVIIHSNVDIASSFLYNHLNIHPGDLYNESLLQQINKRLLELPYLKQAKAWQMSFALDENILNLYLESRKSNQLNGLIGLQPNAEETGKFLLTADILLGLQNTLGYGETLNATYQNLQYKSPRFQLQGIAPFLLGTAFGLDGSFDLFKKDSTFRRTSFSLGLRYQFQVRDYVKVFYTHLSNRLISPDTQYVRQHNTLPENLDILARGLGLYLEMNRSNYILNPSKGWEGNISATALLRTVIPNDAITEMAAPSGQDYTALYEAANTEKYQYKLTGMLGWYLSPFKNMVLHLRYEGGYLSGENLFQNERFQIGGIKLLRGFDEQSLYVNQYHIGTAELRFILGQNSFFYLFSDNAFTYTRLLDFKKADYPVSFGGGLRLQNENGIFHIALGLGKHSGELFEFKRTRIHFGYVAYF